MEAKRKGLFELSTDARILYNVLEKGLIKEGKEIVTYKELSDSIARNVQKEAGGLLRSARRKIQRNHGVLLEAVVNVGIQKSEDYEGAVDKCNSHVRRALRRRKEDVLRAIDGKDIKPELAAKLSLMEVMSLFAKPQAPKKLIEHIENKQLREVSTAETLKLFQQNT